MHAERRAEVASPRHWNLLGMLTTVHKRDTSSATLPVLHGLMEVGGFKVSWIKCRNARVSWLKERWGRWSWSISRERDLRDHLWIGCPRQCQTMSWRDFSTPDSTWERENACCQIHTSCLHTYQHPEEADWEQDRYWAILERLPCSNPDRDFRRAVCSGALMPYRAGSNIHLRAPKEKMVPVCSRQCPGNWENQPLWDSLWQGSCFGVSRAALPSRPRNRSLSRRGQKMGCFLNNNRLAAEFQATS